jgi:hypothetical protein
MNQDERELWRIGDVECVMISCCSGAELQVRQGDAIVLRELYPTKSDLYERARALKTDYAAAADAVSPGDRGG